MVVSRRPSSTFIIAPSAPSTGRISRSKRPSAVACAARCWLCAPKRVEVVAGDAPLVGDQLGRDALRHEAALVGVAGADLGPERVAELAVGHRGTHRHTGHHLDAGGDDDVVGAGDHALGGEVGGLLARPALAVDGGAGDVLRPAGGEHGVAGDVDALLADLHHAAHDDVVDERRVDAGAVDERLQRLRGEVDGVPVLELAVALPERCADGFDDHGGGHPASLLPERPGPRPVSSSARTAGRWFAYRGRGVRAESLPQWVLAALGVMAALRRARGRGGGRRRRRRRGRTATWVCTARR